MIRRAYQTDLSDAEWECIEPHLPIPRAPGRPRVHPLREILNAIFYVVRSGCAWRLVPHDFPPWKTVYHYFRSWRLDGTWERMHTAPCANECGFASKETLSLEQPLWIASRSRRPGYAEKSVATTEPRRSKALKAPLAGGYAGFGARGESPQRESGGQREGIKLLLDPSSPDRLPRISHLWLDAGYTGEGKGADWVHKVVGWTPEIVRHPPKLVPDEVMRRWVMEWAKEGVAIDRERFFTAGRPEAHLAEEVDRGAQVLVALSEQEAKQRLRAAA
jgi:putative transposase